MSLTKELIEQENDRSSVNCMEIHFHKEGSFLRAYDWSAWHCCHYLHEFKVNKRTFKGIEEPVVYIGFPETSLEKWMPEGAEQHVVDEKHLIVRLPDLMMIDSLESMQSCYEEWKTSIPLTETGGGKKKEQSKADGAKSRDTPYAVSLTSVMQRVLAWPIESKSPLESVAFLADIKQQLVSLI